MLTQHRRVGFRFRPKIEFLIKLLQFKAAGGGDISGCTEFPNDLYFLDLYGPEKEPWKMFSGEHEIRELHDVNKSTIKEKYVLTRLTKPRVKNVTRTAGAGSWDDQSTQRHVEIDGSDLGYWRTLTYEYLGGDGAEANKDYYYMNELHLTEQGLEEVGAESTDFVICRILKNELKRCRIKHGKKRAIGQNDACPVTKKKAKMTKKNKRVQFQEKVECCSEFQASTSGTKEIDDDQPIDYKTANLRESMPDFYGILEQDEQDFFQQGNFSAVLMDDCPQMQGNLDQAQQFSSAPVYFFPDQCSDYPDASNYVHQQEEAYVPNLSGLEQYQQFSSAPFHLVPDQYSDCPDASNFVHQQEEAYVPDLSGLEQCQPQQIAEYLDSSCVPDHYSALEEYQQQEVVYLDDDFFSGVEQYQQQEPYGGECSGYEENKEEEEEGLGTLQYLMDSPVMQVDSEQYNNQWSMENLENFFMGGVVDE